MKKLLLVVKLLHCYTIVILRVDFILEARNDKQDVGEPDASLLWNHVCFSSMEIWYFLYQCFVARVVFLTIFGLFANVISQDNGGMLLLLGMIDQCLKAGKKQSWHAASVTNICVGLLVGLKVLDILLWFV